MRQQRLGLPEGGSETFPIRQQPAHFTELRQQRFPAFHAVKLSLKGGVQFRRLGGAELRINAKAKRSGKAYRQPIRRQTLPVFHSASVVLGIVSLKAAQQQLPLQKRRPQADALQGGAGVVVLTGFRLSKSEENAVKIGVKRFRQEGASGRFLLNGGVGRAGQDAGLGGLIRRLSQQLQRLFYFSAASEFFRHLLQPNRSRMACCEGGVKHRQGAAGLPLDAQLLGAAEIGLVEQFEVSRRRFGFMDLLGQVESLLETAFADRLLRPAFHDRPRRRDRRAVFLLCQGETPRRRVGGGEFSPCFSSYKGIRPFTTAVGAEYGISGPLPVT